MCWSFFCTRVKRLWFNLLKIHKIFFQPWDYLHDEDYSQLQGEIKNSQKMWVVLSMAEIQIHGPSLRMSNNSAFQPIRKIHNFHIWRSLEMKQMVERNPNFILTMLIFCSQNKPGNGQVGILFSWWVLQNKKCKALSKTLIDF